MRTDVYRVRDDLLSPAEASFYRVLRLAAGDRYLIWPKVNLADLFYVTQPHLHQAARARIAQKHVDFLLCDPSSLKPLLGLELDDGSHRREERQARDRFVDEVFRAAGLPLARVPVRGGYEPAQLASLLAQVAESGGAAASRAVTSSPTVPNQANAAPAPACPKCGVPMVLRTAQRGERRGSQFFGCINYPKCRRMLPIDELQG